MNAKVEKISVVDGNLIVEIESSATVADGKATLFFKNHSSIQSSEKENYILDSRTTSAHVDRVYLNYPQKTGVDAIAESGGGAAVSILTIVTFIASANYAIMLIKIYQMLDFMLLYNVVYPVNFQTFISIFRATNPLEQLPRLLNWLTDDNCPQMGDKFEDQNMSC